MIVDLLEGEFEANNMGTIDRFVNNPGTNTDAPISAFVFAEDGADC